MRIDMPMFMLGLFLLGLAASVRPGHLLLGAGCGCAALILLYFSFEQNRSAYRIRRQLLILTQDLRSFFD